MPIGNDLAVTNLKPVLCTVSCCCCQKARAANAGRFITSPEAIQLTCCQLHTYKRHAVSSCAEECRTCASFSLKIQHASLLARLEG